MGLKTVRSSIINPIKAHAKALKSWMDTAMDANVDAKTLSKSFTAERKVNVGSALRSCNDAKQKLASLRGELGIRSDGSVIKTTYFIADREAAKVALDVDKSEREVIQAEATIRAVKAYIESLAESDVTIEAVEVAAAAG